MGYTTDMLSQRPRKSGFSRHSRIRLGISFVSIVCILAYYICQSNLTQHNGLLWVGPERVHPNSFNSHQPTIEVSDFNKISEFQLLQIPVSRNVSRRDFHRWLKQQSEISFKHMLQNICSPESSEKFDGCVPGIVFASPSKNDPDYFYHWIRDGAITINTLINTFLPIDRDKTIHTVLNYVNASIDLQQRSNPSGSADDVFLRNLGEPKYHVNNEPYELVWGRPQNDGPALRAIALLNFLDVIGKEKSSRQEAEANFHWIFDDVIEKDLMFVLYNWNAPTYDLWEEVHSYHFFTSMVQLKALLDAKKYLRYQQEGRKHDSQDSQQIRWNERRSDLLKLIDDGVEKLTSFIKDSRSGFVNHEKGYIVETPSILDQRSGLDIAVIMASTLTHDEVDTFTEDSPNFHLSKMFDSVVKKGFVGTRDKRNNEDNGTPLFFDIDDPFILNHFNELVEKMAVLYPINHNRIGTNMGIAVGRYPEDIYDGIGLSEGNPWFISTLSSAELIYKLVHKMYRDERHLVINSSENKFWNKIYSFGNMKQQSSIVIPYKSQAFNQTLQTIFKYGDSFLNKVNEHVSDEGSMSEQFNKYHGYNQGAADLTWSYGTFCNALRWRQIVESLIYPTY